jgi:hypothetical protein
MASKTERTIINAAGLAQGIVLVTFPAASTIFTDTSEYGVAVDVHRDPVHAERQPRTGAGTQRSLHLMPGRIGIVGRRPVLYRRGERHGAAQRDLAQGREDLGLRDVVQRPAPVIRPPRQLPAQPLIQ